MAVADKGKPNGTKVSNRERGGSEAKEVRRRSLVMEDLGAAIDLTASRCSSSLNLCLQVIVSKGDMRI